MGPEEESWKGNESDVLIIVLLALVDIGTWPCLVSKGTSMRNNATDRSKS